VIGRSPGFRSSPARDTRCLAEFEPAYSPSWRMPTRGPPVGGQALSRRQPLIPVSHRSQPKWAAVPREKCETVRGFEGLRDVPGLRGSCRSRQARSRSIRSSWLRLREGHRAQPKVAKAMAGETTLREVPKAQAGRGFLGPSGSRATEGISDRGSSARSRGALWRRSRLVARRGSLRNGGRRAGRPATRCQRPCTGRTGLGRKRRTVRSSAGRSGCVS
jgi:hypothetical protein